MEAVKEIESARNGAETRKDVDACGAVAGVREERLSFYTLFWIFLITSFVGCVVETIFMFVAHGVVQNRSGVLYGSFSLVWGLGAVLFTLCFRKLARRGLFWVFLAGTGLGAAYEYVCSWVQEILFGARFWDYSRKAFNLNGRINLVFSLFWGLAAALWISKGYPLVRKWLSRFSARSGKPVTLVLAVLMLADIALSAAALGRMDRRNSGVPAANAVEVFLDEHYPDEVLQGTFSNLRYIGSDKAREALGLSGRDGD